MSPRALALILAGAACAPAEERSWPRMSPAEALTWVEATPHQCSGPEPTPFGARFEPDGAVRFLPGGPAAGSWSITPAGAVCVLMEGERNPACWGLARSNYGVAVFLVSPLDRGLAVAEAPLRSTRPDAGRAHCTRA
jgi:hypothetical protein